jgi:peptide subunit release factor 1 (eRF1)
MLDLENFIQDYLHDYPESDFYSAVERLKEDEILIETQYAFLGSILMENEKEVLKRLLEKYGYDAVEELHVLSFSVRNYGYMAAIFRFNEYFLETADVKKAVIEYFDKKSF